MTSLNFKCTPLRTAALLAALGLGGALSAPAWAAGPATAPAPAATSTATPPGQTPHAKAPDVVEDVTLFDVVPGTVYLNGGVGQNDEARMHKDAHNWPLRMTFSDKSSDEFVAGVKLKVFDKAGQAVLRLKDAGPMTFVQLPQGEYHVTASYKGDTLTRNIHIGPKGMDANFHWVI